MTLGNERKRQDHTTHRSFRICIIGIIHLSIHLKFKLYPLIVCMDGFVKDEETCLQISRTTGDDTDTTFISKYVIVNMLQYVYVQNYRCIQDGLPQVVCYGHFELPDLAMQQSSYKGVSLQYLCEERHHLPLTIYPAIVYLHKISKLGSKHNILLTVHDILLGVFCFIFCSLYSQCHALILGGENYQPSYKWHCNTM